MTQAGKQDVSRSFYIFFLSVAVGIVNYLFVRVVVIDQVGVVVVIDLVGGCCCY